MKAKKKKEDPKSLRSKYKYFQLYLFPIFTLAIGYYLGTASTEVESTQKLTKRSAMFHNISPLLDCDDREADLNASFSRELKDKIADDLKLLDREESVSVYYRDLYNGPTVLINGDALFYAASLTKIPTMLAYLKHAENHPELLYKKINYKYSNKDYFVEYQPEQKLIDGESYTVQNLLLRMIAYSDNGARSLLIKDVFDNIANYIPSNAVHIDSYENTLEQLIGKPVSKNNIDEMKVKDVATFFRILFNATFLTKKYSSLALDMLSQTTFSHGIKQGIPDGIQIAHKFGEMYVEQNKERQLHDCGIIYHTQRPYILCIMTKGRESKKLEKIISKISETVYQMTDSSLLHD